MASKIVYVHNERCIATVVVKGMNFPRNIRSRERMVQGTNVPGKEQSWERIFQHSSKRLSTSADVIVCWLVLGYYSTQCGLR